MEKELKEFRSIVDESLSKIRISEKFKLRCVQWCKEKYKKESIF